MIGLATFIRVLRDIRLLNLHSAAAALLAVALTSLIYLKFTHKNPKIDTLEPISSNKLIRKYTYLVCTKIEHAFSISHIRHL